MISWLQLKDDDGSDAGHRGENRPHQTHRHGCAVALKISGADGLADAAYKLGKATTLSTTTASERFIFINLRVVGTRL